MSSKKSIIQIILQGFNNLGLLHRLWSLSLYIHLYILSLYIYIISYIHMSYKVTETVSVLASAGGSAVTSLSDV